MYEELIVLEGGPADRQLACIFKQAERVEHLAHYIGESAMYRRTDRFSEGNRVYVYERTTMRACF